MKSSTNVVINLANVNPQFVDFITWCWDSTLLSKLRSTSPPISSLSPHMAEWSPVYHKWFRQVGWLVDVMLLFNFSSDRECYFIVRNYTFSPPLPMHFEQLLTLLYLKQSYSIFSAFQLINVHLLLLLVWLDVCWYHLCQGCHCMIAILNAMCRDSIVSKRKDGKGGMNAVKCGLTYEESCEIASLHPFVHPGPYLRSDLHYTYPGMLACFLLKFRQSCHWETIAYI
jgi:hypothetical protein